MRGADFTIEHLPGGDFKVVPHVADNGNEQPDLAWWLAWPFKHFADPRANKLRVLVACEYSATVRDAFRARGFDAWSCDILPTEGNPAWHIQDSLQHVLCGSRWPMWDLIVAHPPCTHLSVSGARHFAAKQASGVQEEALDFVRMILAANCDHIALENPVSIISSRIRKPDQIVQPWQFGHGETKATCLWLKNLPRLNPTNVVEGREARIHKMPPGPDRWKERSRTFPGIAAAMADQWGDYILSIAARDHAPFNYNGSNPR